MCPFVDIVTLFLLSMFSQKRTTRNPLTINQHFAKAFEYDSEKEREELRKRASNLLPGPNACAERIGVPWFSEGQIWIQLFSVGFLINDSEDSPEGTRKRPRWEKNSLWRWVLPFFVL